MRCSAVPVSLRLAHWLGGGYILGPMKVLVLLFAAFLMAQDVPAQSGGEERRADGAARAERERTYEFKLDDGSSLFGTLHEERGDDIIILLDNPFLPREARRVRKDRSEIRVRLIEGEEEREARLTELYRERGLVRLRGPNGRVLAAPIGEYAVASRAHALAMARKEAPQGADWNALLEEVGHAPAQAEAALPDAPPPEPARRWGLAAGILAAAAVLIGVVLKTLVFAKSSQAHVPRR